MGTIRNVDLGLLGHFVPPGVFTRIDPEVEALLGPLPEVRDRVAGCVEFCGRLELGTTGPSPEELPSRRKYLRGALAEFASMDDAVQVDFANLSKQPPRMHASLDPRIHVVRLLRHANVHLSATTLSHSSRNAVWDGPAGRQEFEYPLPLGENLESSIRATREATQYEPSDLAAMIEWLDAEQREWGIAHTVLRSAELYAAIAAAAI